jgi:hypothetical protein
VSARSWTPLCAAALVFAGCGSNNSNEATTAAQASATTTAVTAPAVTAAATATTATTATPPAPAPGKASKKPVAPGGQNKGPKKNYSGDGSQDLSLTLARNSVLRWKVDGKSFKLSDPSGRLKVSGGASGQTFAAKGDYPHARVTADGKWTLTVEQLAAPDVKTP